MGRKKRRSSKFKDSSTVIDIEQARKERQQRQEERRRKQEKAEQKRGTKKPSRTGSVSARASSAAAAASEFAASARKSAEQAIYGEPEGPSGVRQDRRKMALRKRKRNRNLIIASVLAGLLVLVGFSVGNILVLKHDLHTAQKQQETYIEEKEQLEKDLKEIDDLENLEEQARNQMRLIKPGETLYIFPENMNPQQADQEETKEDTSKDENDQKETQ